MPIFGGRASRGIPVSRHRPRSVGGTGDLQAEILVGLVIVCSVLRPSFVRPCLSFLFLFRPFVVEVDTPMRNYSPNARGSDIGARHAQLGLLLFRKRRGAALLRWRPNQSLRRRRGRRQLDPSRRGEERRRVRWPTVLLSSATDGGLPLVLARFVRGLSTHQGSGCLRRLRTAATAAKCHRAPVDSHRVADQMPTGPSMSRRRAPHAASPLPRG